jgi:hypothetical protein
MGSFDKIHTLNIEELQKIVDHFGIGKVNNIDMSQSIEISTHFLNLYFITINKGQFVVIEYPSFIEKKSEIQKEVDKKFNFQKPVFRYPSEDKIQFAHVADKYYSVRCY